MSFTASSSSSSSSIPNSSSSQEERPYEVFLTTQIIGQTICSLRTSFMDAAVRTYIDGDGDITSTLLEAIEEARFVIFVFTKDFGTCRKCLDKVDKIMEYHKTMGKKVFPMFCGVNVLDVRQRISTIQELVSRGLLQRQDFFRWRSAATEALSLNGWTISANCSRYDKKIREITHSIKIALHATYLDLPPHLVGIQPRVKEVLNLSKYYSNDITVREENVIVEGIWGPSGIGKTTIARIIYDTINGNFERRSFLASIKDVWEEENGHFGLQEQLISDISGSEPEKIINTEMGIRQIKRVVHNRRALIVLDDVDHIDQLEALCGSHEWFGFGSMILITSRNKHIFDHLKVKYVYEVKKLDKIESLELFSWNAFKKSSPCHNFVNLAKNVTAHCEGLPLVLEVVGSLLLDRIPQDWDIVLKTLKSTRASQIQEKLKISCESLDGPVKDLFIDIACSHVGEKVSAFQFPVEDGINILVKRNLVKVDMDNRLCMHQLLQEIGKGGNHNRPKPKSNYHVLLSFCGDDTRKSFATHLYNELKNAGIVVFMDNGIKKGEEIPSSLMRAIASTGISIIVFSIRYAGSSWCLQELEKIMECHRTTQQKVLPIFYGVPPSDVRNQNGDFGNELKKLKRKINASKDQNSNWKRALNEAANLCGWHSDHYRDDAELIDCVVETVKAELSDNTF